MIHRHLLMAQAWQPSGEPKHLQNGTASSSKLLFGEESRRQPSRRIKNLGTSFKTDKL
jgi:hypothetical protein